MSGNESRGSSLDSCSDEERIPQLEENDPLADLIARMTPYLKCDPESAKERLHTLGIKNISDFSVVTENDVLDIMQPIRYRLFSKQLKEGAQSTNITSVSSTGYILNLKHVVSSKLLTALNGPETLSDLERRMVVDCIADDIEENMRIIREDQMQTISSTLIKSHSNAFGCIHLDEEEMLLAAHNLKNSLMYRIHYKRRKSANSSEPKRKRTRFSSSEEYGLQGGLDLPSLSTPDVDDLESKRKLLLNQFESDEYNLNFVKQLMTETSILQRHDINRKLDLHEIKTRWPFIGQTDILQDHFFSLMDMEPSSVDKNLKDELHTFLKFFEYLSTKKRKGAAKEVPDKILKILQVYHKNKENEGTGTGLLAVILCIIHHLQLPQKALFLMFEDTANYQEIQSSNLSNDGFPLIAVLGSSFFSSGTVAYVVVDNVVLWEKPVPLATAIHIMFMSYFIFKIAYNPLLAPVLEFMQRNIYNIRSSGTRVARKKSKNGNYSHAIKDVTPKFSSFIKQYKQYISKYSF